MRHASLFALVLVAFLLQACYTVPVTGRSAFIMTSVAEEKALGLEAYNAYKTNSVVLNDYAINNRIKTIGQRIAKIAEQDTPGMEWEWEFVVFNDSQTANAWCQRLVPARRQGGRLHRHSPLRQERRAAGHRHGP